MVLAGFFYYFAFGSNLLDERIHVQIKGAEFETVAYLNNYELGFFDTGERWKGAIASIEPKNGSEVWGCVWRVPMDFSDELDAQESGYHQLNGKLYNKDALCVLNNGNILYHLLIMFSVGSVRTYQYSNDKRKKQAPSPHYKAVIIAGAIEHQFPGWYIDQLKAIKDNGYKGRVELDLDAIKELNEQADKDKGIDITTTDKPAD